MMLSQIFLICILSITSLSAFTFDKWKSGIELSQAIDIARENNIPLTTQGSVFLSKKFDWQYLRNYQKYRVFYYRDDLLGEKARISLYFTKDSKILYKIKVHWSLIGTNKKEFEEILYRLLDKKYGKKSIIIPSNVGEYIFYKKRMWKVDLHTVVKSQKSLAGVDLTYLDEKYEFDDFQTKKKKKLKIIVKDAGKF